MGVSYICKRASASEMQWKWDEEIRRHPEDANWRVWKSEALKSFDAGGSVPYYGILDGQIICEATAMTDAERVQNGSVFLDARTVYLCAFHTLSEYRGQGYFSALLRFMLNDLKEAGYAAAVLGVEPQETKNKAIYRHFGFCDFLFRGTEVFPDGTKIEVEYYEKKL